jgi:hypothetical protein
MKHLLIAVKGTFAFLLVLMISWYVTYRAIGMSEQNW